MANYNKSFNFRNGVQVDEDNFLVASTGLVGIGTTIPRTELDVYGNSSVTGLVTSKDLFVSGIATFNDVRIGTGITIYGNAGIISATFYGDGSNLRGVPTSQWVDVDVGLGYTSIYAVGNVGVATTSPTATFQVGGRTELGENGVGITSSGNVYVSGILTSGNFVGVGSLITRLDANAITLGILSAGRLPSSILISGIATVGFLSASNVSVSGISTLNSVITNTLNVTNLSVGGMTTVGFITSPAGYIGNFTSGIITSSSANITNLTLGSVNVSGVSTVGLISASDAFVSGVATITTLRSTTGFVTSLTSSLVNSSTASITNLSVGVATVGFVTATNIFVGILTSALLRTNDINVSGVTTSTRIKSGDIQIGFGGTNTINTEYGDLVLNSNSQMVQVGDNLFVSGRSFLSGITTVANSFLPATDLGSSLGSPSKYFSNLYVGTVNIGIGNSSEINTRDGNLILTSIGGTVSIQNNLAVSGVSTFIGRVSITNEIVPSVDQGTRLGISTLRFLDAYVGDARIFGSTLDTTTGDLNLDSNSGTTRINDDLIVSGISSFTGGAILSGVSTVTTGLVPLSDSGAHLGTQSLSFSEAYIDNVKIGVGSDQEISTVTGDLRLDADSDLVDVNANLLVSGTSYLTGVTTVAGGLLPNADKSQYLGESTKSFGSAYINEVQIGVGDSARIDTRPGYDLELSADTSTVKVISDRFTVTQVSNLNGNVYAGFDGLSLTVDTLNNRIGIGTSAPTENIQIASFSGNSSTLELYSSDALARIGLGQSSIGAGQSTTSITNDGRDFIIDNEGNGNIINVLHSGDDDLAGINTGSFIWRYGQTNDALMALTYDGRLGLGRTDPRYGVEIVPLPGAGTSTTLYVQGYGRYTGIVTVAPEGSSTGGIVLDGLTDTLTVPNLVVTNSTAGVTASGVGITVTSDTTATSGIAYRVEFPSSDFNVTIASGVASVRLATNAGFSTVAAVGIGTDLVHDPDNTKIEVYGNNYTTGITSSLQGFTSGIGTAVQITTVGNQLVFTVAGVGSTSLTLY